MDVRKVTLTPTTKAQLQNPTLSQRRRDELRKEAALEYIRSLPAGKPINAIDVNRAVGIKTRNSSFVRRLERYGLISIQKIPHSYKAIYTVNADVKVTKPSVTQSAPPPRGHHPGQEDSYSDSVRPGVCLVQEQRQSPRLHHLDGWKRARTAEAV